MNTGLESCVMKLLWDPMELWTPSVALTHLIITPWALLALFDNGSKTWHFSIRFNKKKHAHYGLLHFRRSPVVVCTVRNVFGACCHLIGLFALLLYLFPFAFMNWYRFSPLSSTYGSVCPRIFQKWLSRVQHWPFGLCALIGVCVAHDFSLIMSLLIIGYLHRPWRIAVIVGAWL